MESEDDELFLPSEIDDSEAEHELEEELEELFEEEVESDEDVVEVASNTPPRRVNPPDQLPLPRLTEALTQQNQYLRREGSLSQSIQLRPIHHHHHHHHHPRPHHHHHSRNHETRPHHHHRSSRQATSSRQSRPSSSTRAPAEYIDLTEEPDSPSEVQPSQPHSQYSQHTAGGNPRRTHSQRTTPPTLARSDGTLSRSNMADFVDLTADSPEEEPPLTRQRTSRHQARPPVAYRGNAPRLSSTDSLISVGLVRGTGGTLAGLSRFGRTFAGFMALGLDTGSWARAPPFANPTSTAASPKPSLEPAPPTRPGFTRDTRAESEDAVAICPCCEDELAYDPFATAPSTSSTTTPAKGKKRKRAAAEHHFWALKKCGHVYCASCFENRKPTRNNKGGIGFHAPAGKDPYTAFNELTCCVEGCESKIAMKGEWIGLYT